MTPITYHLAHNPHNGLTTITFLGTGESFKAAVEELRIPCHLFPTRRGIEVAGVHSAFVEKVIAEIAVHTGRTYCRDTNDGYYVPKLAPIR